jgi:hypothetical protein
VATKWPGLAFLACALVLTVVHESRSRKGAGLRAALREEGLSILGCFVAIPAFVYVLSYIGWAEGSLLAWPWSSGSWIRDVLADQWRMFRFHDRLDIDHFYASPPWSWPMLKRPMVYFYEPTGGGYRVILALGSPLIWWASLVSLAGMLLAWTRHRGAGPAGTILCAFTFAWLPWFAVDLVRAPLFLFYLLPAVPFMCIAVGWAALRFSRSGWGKLVVAALSIGAVVLFAYYHPVLAARPISVESWRNRMLFTDCELQGLTLSDIEIEDLEAPPDAPGPYPEALLRTGAPPAGWCWI